MTKLDSFLSTGPIPSIFIFDLDYTLWSAYIDCTSGPPYTLLPATVTNTLTPTTVLDRTGHPIRLYPHSRLILRTLHEKNCAIGVASRSETPRWAHDVTCTLFPKDMFKKGGIEIYPTSKRRHFKEFKKKTGVEYEDMVFFDDECRNVREVERLGVTCEFVPDGITVDAVVAAIEKWRVGKVEKGKK